jgi:hypothetical protein
MRKQIVQYPFLCSPVSVFFMYPPPPPFRPHFLEKIKERFSKQGCAYLRRRRERGPQRNSDGFGPWMRKERAQRENKEKQSKAEKTHKNDSDLHQKTQTMHAKQSDQNTMPRSVAIKFYKLHGSKRQSTIPNQTKPRKTI